MPALAAKYSLAGKRKQRLKRRRPRTFTAHGFQSRPGRTDKRKIKEHIISVKPSFQAERKSVRPAFLTVRNDISRQFFARLFLNLRKRLNIFAFYRPADTGPTHG